VGTFLKSKKNSEFSGLIFGRVLKYTCAIILGHTTLISTLRRTLSKISQFMPLLHDIKSSADMLDDEIE
jgi:hypothetical protein